ncbi:MAG: metallophosphoesterase, partial [Desulfobacteraceae bacterium]|nr:metallophosphoesterase [Desulfobacteraceae bacterium]
MAEKPQDEIRESAIKNDASELEKELLSAYKELNSTALTWLHLSDLQIKDDANNEMLDGLLADIEQVISKDKVYPDLIFVTGDIAFSGQESEYQLAEGFFERLLNITNIEENRLFLIPGNHDINWTEDPSNEYNVQFPTQESSGPLEIEYPMRGLRNFIDYSRRWLSPSGHPWFGQSVNSVLIKINGTNIKIVLIDTSWMGYVIPNSPLNPQEIDNIKYGLVSGVQDSYSPGFENAEYVITLLHHPVDSLQNELKKTSGSFDEKAINPLLEGSDFILHSHVNDNSSPGILSRDPIIINGGSLPGLIEHPNLYNWVLVDPITGDSNIKIRFFSQQDNSWTPFHTYPVLVSEKKPELDGPPLAGFTADIVDQQDQLGITPDVNAFSSVIASTEVEPPLCLGLFGDWGSGKTFFMDQMYRRIELLAKRAKAAEDSVDNNPGDEPL